MSSKKPFYVNFETPSYLLKVVYELIKEARLSGKIEKGTNETTRAVINGKAKLVLIAEDVDPPEVVAHFPVLCEELRIPYVFIPSKYELGKVLDGEIDFPVASACVVDAGRAEGALIEILVRLASIKRETYIALASEVKINPIFRGRNFKIEKDLCFVLMPFQEPFFRIYRTILKPSLEKLGLRVIKADDVFTPTVIIEDIWE